MKKKALSLALALAMCLGLAVPAFAAEAGDTAVTDTKGNSYTLSSPILYTISKEQLQQIPLAKDYFTDEIMEGQDFPLESITQAYAVPVGTIIAAPADIHFEGFIWVDTKKENGTYAAADTGMGTPLLNSIALDDEEGNTFWILPCYTGIEEGSVDKTYVSSIAFFTPSEENVQTNPFVSSEDHTDPKPADPAPAYQVSNWAKDRVAVAVETGLAADSLGSDYRVNITRAQFAVTAVKLYQAMGGKAEAAGESSFTDTTDPVILQAADLGFVSGVGGGRFDPEALVTREQAAVMLSSVYTKLGGEIPAVEATTFADNGDVAGWARNAVAFMNEKEIVTGVGNNSFSPKGNASIEQALLISLKMFETLK